MRFVHISDLHIGHRLCDRDRFEEHDLYFSWLLDKCREWQADYVVITGDIFDTASPSNTALKMYYRFLAGLPSANISGALIIGGNHDSPSSLSAPRELLESFNVFVRGSKSTDPREDVVVVTDASGFKTACGLVPYLRERDIRIPKAGESSEDRDSGIKQGIQEHYRNVMKAAEAKHADAVLLTGHLFAAGYGTGRGEHDLYVGNLGHISLDALPAKSSYTALGHIHIPGKIGPQTAYAGSPIPMDFGESAGKKVILVDLPGDIEAVPVPLFRRLLRFKGTFEEILRQINVIESSGLSPYGLSPWSEAVVQKAIPDPSMAGEIENALNEKGIELLRIRIESGESPEDQKASQRDLDEISPKEMFELRCARKGVELTEDLSFAFDELLESVRQKGESSDED